MGIPENQKCVYAYKEAVYAYKEAVYAYKEACKMWISNVYAYIGGARDPQQVCIHGLLQ
jgi:hypothetical protein